MKRFCILSLYIFFVSLLYAQTVEVDGAYRWTGVNKSETGLDYVFVTLHRHRLRFGLILHRDHLSIGIDLIVRG